MINSFNIIAVFGKKSNVASTKAKVASTLFVAWMGLIGLTDKLQRLSLPAIGISTAVWVRCCTTNFAGLTFLTGYFQARSDSSPLPERPPPYTVVGAPHLGFRC